MAREAVYSPKITVLITVHTGSAIKNCALLTALGGVEIEYSGMGKGDIFFLVSSAVVAVGVIVVGMVVALVVVLSREL